jgi:hypothetical protein
VPATQESHVHAVAGSAVCDSHLVRPVIVRPLTHVNDTRSTTLPLHIFSLHDVTVGATATVIVVATAESQRASVLL